MSDAEVVRNIGCALALRLETKGGGGAPFMLSERQSAVFGEAHFADVGQIAVPLGVVDAIAHDKFIRN